VGHRNPVRVEERELILRLRAEGLTKVQVVERTGRSGSSVDRVVAAAGGLPPRDRHVRPGVLTTADREEISRRLAVGQSSSQIAVALGRAVSTISREVRANGGRHRYRAWAAERRAAAGSRRPKQAKLAVNGPLRAQVEEWLALEWSPEQISIRLKVDYPDDPEMRVSHETIYQSLFIQGRGALRKELTASLRTGRTVRRPHGTRAERRGKLADMVMITDRPAEVEDRAVPGHWEGDLIIGAHGRSAIATLVERSSRYVQLVALPEGRTAPLIRDALTASVTTLPAQLWQSLTWDQGKEMAEHVQFKADTNIDVFFCDPHSPWQRGSNENTNGLLRQYLPKSTNLSRHTQTDLDRIAARLNGRPRKTLGGMTPSEKLTELIAATA
jgi:IS30 family transposase